MKIEQEMFRQRLEQKLTIHETEQDILTDIRAAEIEAITCAEIIAAKKGSEKNMVLYYDYNIAVSKMRIRTDDYISYTLKYKLALRK